MKLRNNLCGALLVLGAFADRADAATDMNGSAVLSYTISNTGLTRISIEGDTIKDMFAYPATVSSNLNLHPSGHVFVAPAGLTEPIFLTVISGTGVPQDLKLTFADKAPKPLILKVKTEKIVSKEDIERWMSVALRGEAPRHFTRCSHASRTITSSTTHAQEYDAFSNGVYTISLWTVSSTEQAPVSLTADLYIDGEEAGKLSETELGPLASTTLVIISKNKDMKK